MLACEPVDDPDAAKTCRHLDQTVGIFESITNNRCVPSERMSAHGFEQHIGGVRRNDCDKLALIGDIERIETQQFAERSNGRRDRP